jgi:hypothetical protein
MGDTWREVETITKIGETDQGVTGLKKGYDKLVTFPHFRYSAGMPI